MKTLVSRHDPIVGAFRELIDTPDAAGRRLLLDGAHLVRDAAAAGLEFEVAAVSTAHLAGDTEQSALTEQLRRDGVEVLTVTEQVLGAMSPVRTPSGIVAIIRRPPAALADICQQREGLLLVIVDVQDPGNVGSLIRAAEAGGVTGVIVCGASASPFGWKALRGSMGSTLRLPVGTGVTVDAALTCLKAFNTRTIATAATGGHDPDAVDWTGRTALLLGGEGAGLTSEVIAACDARVTIPMSPPVESLNVAAAGAVLIYAARRQRAGAHT
jgi:RNA methyltransferase, TrmH family